MSCIQPIAFGFPKIFIIIYSHWLIIWHIANDMPAQNNICQEINPMYLLNPLIHKRDFSKRYSIDVLLV